MSKDLQRQVGEHLMIGVPGPKMTPAMKKQVKKIRPGGIIFFRPNFSTAKDFRRLVSDLEDAAEKKMVMAVDHEGGRVIHLAEKITVFPDNLTLGNTENPDHARSQGKMEARELRSLGINLNLAPTVDVLCENFSPNIGIRSYGRDPGLAARFGAERIKALQANGISACAKHFPGQGQSAYDAHLDLPVLFSSNEEMKKIHLKPFEAAIKAGVDAVMSSHPIYPNLDKARRPATFSKEIISGILRTQLGFQGAILSDDLEMGALKDICRIGESAVRAVEAGHDMVLVCHGLKNQDEVFEGLLKAYESGRLDPWNLEKSLVRIERLKNKYADIRPGAPVFSESRALAEKISRLGVRRSKNHAGFSFKKGETISAIFPRLSELDERIFIEKEMLDEKKFLSRAFAGLGWKAGQIQVTCLKVSQKEIEDAHRLSGNVIFFCYDAHLDPGTREILKVLQKLHLNLAVVLLRDPYDIEFVEKQTACVSAYGFRASQVLSALELLK